MLNKMLLNAIVKSECRRCVVPYCVLLTKHNASQHCDNNQSKQQSNRVRVTNDGIQHNPYYDKYAHKIDKALRQMCDERDVRDVALDSEKLEESRVETKNQFFRENKLNAVSTEENQSNRLKHSSETFGRHLNDIVKVDLLVDKTSQQITDIWNDYHKHKDYCIYAVISRQTYDTIFSRGSQYPRFVYAVPRLNKSQNDGKSYEFVLAQFSGHRCYFTPLIAYQTHKENAATCLTISHYPELKRDKGIVLMFGEYDNNILNCFEAQCLANQLQCYYGKESTRRTLLLHSFNNEPKLFQYMDVIKELEEGMIGSD